MSDSIMSTCGIRYECGVGVEWIYWVYGSTFVYDRSLVAVVDQCWQIAQIVLVSERLVVYLHESDAQLVGLVVDVLQFLQGLGALAALLLVWRSRQVGGIESGKQQIIRADWLWEALSIETSWKERGGKNCTVTDKQRDLDTDR